MVAAKFKNQTPEAFDGDGVAYLQTVYRDPGLPVDMRIDAAAKSARYERPALAALLTRDVTPAPQAVKLSLDYSLLEPRELMQLKQLIAKAMLRRPEENEMIEGEATEEKDARQSLPSGLLLRSACRHGLSAPRAHR